MKKHTTKKTKWTGMMIASLWITASSAGAGGGKSGNDVFYVLASETPLEITAIQLLANDQVEATSVEVTQPLHGELLSQGPGIYHYRPNESFWVLGVDSFTYAAVYRGSPVAFATVQLVAELHGVASTVATFENGDFGGLEEVPPGSIDISPHAALAGELGMRVGVTGQETYVQSDSDIGGDEGEDSGGCEAELRGPPGVIPRFFTGEQVEVLSVGPAQGLPGIRVLMMRDASQQLYLGAEMPHGQGGGIAWVAVDEGAHEILVDWWKSAGPGRNDGMVLVIDDLVGQQAENIGIDGVEMARYRFGKMTLPTLVFDEIDFDNIVVRTGDGTTPTSTLLLADNFEAGVSTFWGDTSRLVVEPTLNGALNGAAGLEIPLDGHASSYLTQRLFQAQQQYSVRFRIDPSSLQAWVPLVLLDAAAESQEPDSPLLSLSIESGETEGYRIQARYEPFGLTDEVLLPDAPSVIELQWRAATSPGSRDGGLVLWVDGAFAAELPNLSNSGDLIHEVRFGAVDNQAGSGLLRLDDFESWTGGVAWGAVQSQ